MVPWGPPMSDSDDSDDYYEGFYFGTEISKKSDFTHKNIAREQGLYDAIKSADLNKTIDEITALDFDVNDILLNDATPLLLACEVGCYEIVKYLVESGANVNKTVDSVTPLMKICDYNIAGIEIFRRKIIADIASYLISNKAVVNTSDKYGMTPFLFACSRGNLEILEILLPHASIEAKDNCGKTAIHIAIENNHKEVVSFLIKSGINFNVVDDKGYSPRQIAQNHGFDDILDILPKEEIPYMVPVSFLTYNSIRDYIPRIFLKSEVPEYFQEVYAILKEQDLMEFTEYFAKAGISLEQFLTLSDQEMKEIGIELPFQRKKIRMGLLNFHLNYWTKYSITQVKRDARENFYNILMLSGNQLLNLVIINATLKFLVQNLQQQCFGQIDPKDIINMKESLRKYKSALNEMRKTTKYLNSFSPEKSPIYIDYDEIIAERKRNKLKCCLKYSIIIGVSVIICIKFSPSKLKFNLFKL